MPLTPPYMATTTVGIYWYLYAQLAHYKYMGKTYTEYISYTGPIPNNNEGWIPPRQRAAREAGVSRSKYQVSIVKGVIQSIY